jgi:hypothetical protein
MKKIILKLFYHIVVDPITNWQEFTDQQITRMKVAGLYEEFSEIIFCVHVESQEFNLLKDQYANDQRVQFIIHSDSVRPFHEQYTNRSIKKYIDNDTEKSFILRAQNKGITHFNTPNWPANAIIKEEIDYHTIDNWRIAVEKLAQGYDATGTNWVKQPWPHFKGNVWWATSDYIKRLTILRAPHEVGFRQQILGGGWAIHDAESWIGTCTPRSWDLLRNTDQIGDHPDLVKREE